MPFIPYSEAGGRAFVERYAGFTSRLVCDPATGHSKFDPIPPQALLDGYYNGVFTRGEPSPESEFTEHALTTARSLFDYLRDIAGLRERFTYHDVGCGFGAGVWAMRRLGVIATGNETNRAWVDRANRFCDGALSAEPFEATLAGLGYSVDVFFMSHVLEHLPDPLATLQLAARYMSTDGVIYICVPNAHCLRAMVGGRRHDHAYQFPMHLQYFTPKSLAATVHAAGLVPIQVDTRPLDEADESGRTALELALGTPRGAWPDAEAWQRAACANLLGGELFMLAAAPANRVARRDPGIEARIERAFEAFTAAAARRGLGELEAEISRLSAALDEVLGSRSWRWSALLRRLNARLRGVRTVPR